MKDTIDLIPREFSVRRNARSRAAAWATVAAAAFVAAAFSVFSILVQARRGENEVNDLAQRVSAMTATREQLSPLRQQLEQALQQQMLKEQLLIEPAWNDIISDLSAAINGQIWIQNLQLEQPLNQPAGSALAPGLIVTGSASGDIDLLQFMNRFSASPRLEGLVLQQSRPEQAEEGEAARVNFVVQGLVKVGGRAE